MGEEIYLDAEAGQQSGVLEQRFFNRFLFPNLKRINVGSITFYLDVGPSLLRKSVIPGKNKTFLHHSTY